MSIKGPGQMAFPDVFAGRRTPLIFFDAKEVTGSIPVAPTLVRPQSGAVSSTALRAGALSPTSNS